MNESDFKALLSLYDTKNITESAKQLYISQPALTKKIKNIEEWLNAELVIRSTKGITFTSAGEHVIKYAKKFLTDFYEMKEGLDIIANNIQGALRIGVSMMYANHAFPTVINNFLKKNPDIKFMLNADNSSEIFDMLKEKKISVAILRYKFDWDDAFDLLDSEPVCLVCRDKDVRSRLDSVPFVNYEMARSIWQELDKWLVENDIDETVPHITTSDVQTCIGLISQNIGWTVLSSLALKDFDGYKEELFWKDGTKYQRHTYIYYRKNDMKYKQIKTFVDYIREYYSEK